MYPYGDDLTPTKSVSQVSLSPKSQESICILCAESMLNSNFRQRLFTGLTGLVISLLEFGNPRWREAGQRKLFKSNYL